MLTRSLSKEKINKISISKVSYIPKDQIPFILKALHNLPNLNSVVIKDDKPDGYSILVDGVSEIKNVTSMNLNTKVCPIDINK